MSRISRPVLLSLAAALPLFSLGAGTAAADRVIDSFQDALPPTTLPGTSTPAPLIWAGAIGSTSQIEQAATQSGLAGVVGGHRVTRVREASLSTDVIASSTQQAGQPAISYATGSGRSGVLTFEYGATAALNLNLTADGGQAFELDIVGDMDNGSPVRPVQLTITARTGAGAAVSRSYTLNRDGAYQFPFSAFSGVNFADVDYLKLTFDASAVNAIDFVLINGFRTTGCLQTGTPIADRFLDTFRAALPMRSIPGSGTSPILWAGTINGTSKPIDVGVQSGLAGVIGGQRQTTVEASAIQNFLTATMTSNGLMPALGYATGYPTSGSLTLEYGAQTDLNANLSAMRAFEFELDSDLTSGPRPVPLTITVASGSGSASTQVTLLNDKTYYVPFTLFPNVNFADVDYVQFHFDATAVQAVDFDLVGGLRTSACIR